MAAITKPEVHLSITAHLDKVVIHAVCVQVISEKKIFKCILIKLSLICTFDEIFCKITNVTQGWLSNKKKFLLSKSYLFRRLFQLIQKLYIK
jgi:hypothetical protein